MPSALDSLLTFYELDAEGALVCRTRHRAAFAALGGFHDFLVTDNYFIVLENPVSVVDTCRAAILRGE